MRDLERAGVVYRGPYAGGLAALDVASYHALLLTSKSEGLPLVLVQALQLGLPVVASNVGGVPDIILDGETGLLTAGPDDAVGFADAIQRLMDDLGLRRSIIERGRSFAEEHHSWSSFQRTVERDLIPERMLTDHALQRSSPQTSRR
jgi:glycosyltransferase involved in cell wall biosynthesis